MRGSRWPASLPPQLSSLRTDGLSEPPESKEWRLGDERWWTDVSHRRGGHSVVSIPWCSTARRSASIFWRVRSLGDLLPFSESMMVPSSSPAWAASCFCLNSSRRRGMGLAGCRALHTSAPPSRSVPRHGSIRSPTGRPWRCACDAGSAHGADGHAVRQRRGQRGTHKDNPQTPAAGLPATKGLTQPYLDFRSQPRTASSFSLVTRLGLHRPHSALRTVRT